MARHRSQRRDLPQHALETRLTELGALLGAHPAAGPDPAFTGRLRGRLLAVAAVSPAVAGASSSPSTATPVRARRAALLPRLVIGAAAGVVGVAGVGFAAGHALPGQPLYGVKTGSEHLQLDLTHGDASRGRLELAFARTRLHEVGALAAHHELTDAAGLDAAAASDAGGRIAATLARMDAETEAGSSDLVRAARGGDAEAGASLRTFAAVQRTLLAAVAPDLPPTASAALTTSRTVLTRVAAVAADLPGAPPPTTPPSAPTAPVSPVAPTTASASPTGPAGLPTTPAPTSSAAPAAPATPTSTPSAPSAPSVPSVPASSSPATGPSGSPTPAPSTPAPTPPDGGSTPATPVAPTASAAPVTPTVTATSSPPAITVSLAPLPPIALPLPIADTIARPSGSSWLVALLLTLLRALSGQ